MKLKSRLKHRNKFVFKTKKKSDNVIEIESCLNFDFQPTWTVLDGIYIYIYNTITICHVTINENNL